MLKHPRRLLHRDDADAKHGGKLRQRPDLRAVLAGKYHFAQTLSRCRHQLPALAAIFRITGHGTLICRLSLFIQQNMQNNLP